ncbi:MAG: sugar transferase [Candidatus Magasanikbacteria bacterium]|nr:sugar transferase [Candidatus Magasanikbacteria bacterium]
MFYRIKQSLLVLGDFFGYIIALFIALSLRHFEIATIQDMHEHQTLFGITIFFWIVINYINGLYDVTRMNDVKRLIRRLVETAGISLIFSIIFFYILPYKTITPKTILIVTIVVGYVLSGLLRLVWIELLGGLKKFRTNILFIGTTPEMNELEHILQAYPERGYHIAAWVNGPLVKSHEDASKSTIERYTSLKAIRPAISTHHIGLVVIAPHMEGNPEAMRELYELLFWPVQIQNAAAFYEVITGRIPPSTFSEGWFLQHLRRQENPFYEKGKSILDYIAIIVLGFLFCLLFPFIAVAIKLTSNGSIFFKQTRVGRGGKTFFLYKFRSMYSLSPDGSAETNGFQFAIKNDRRVTSVGRFLRKSRLDELPQVLNLVKGDITLIGPRPERPEIVHELTEHMPYYPLRHVMKPGITGWAVLHQNYTDNLETSLQKLQYDLYYIKNKSFLLDISILLKTVNVIVRGLGQ